MCIIYDIFDQELLITEVFISPQTLMKFKSFFSSVVIAIVP